ncbi:Uma2 family endonuclease [uncultured Mucilaginibacter sp.]|uniref:Uma2 family endonuclease n=1 Tax=uncultured Mucilaginibacter sp. TaxID=797541 RepID=UPI00261FAD6A|nr:Uma2 family endonuclease [uncultured Mucilaginibacter sp.]
MLTETKIKFTEKDYMILEEGAPFQLINYDLIMSPSPTHLHQSIIIRLAQHISNYLDKTNDGGYFLIAPTDIFLDEGNVFQPDLIFVSAENRNKIIGGKIDFAPDLCIEILSPSTAYYDIKHKKRMYESYGVKEYVIIDPLDLSAEIYRLAEQCFTLEKTVYAEGNLTLRTITGFSVPFEKLFL